MQPLFSDRRHFNLSLFVFLYETFFYNKQIRKSGSNLYTKSHFNVLLISSKRMNLRIGRFWTEIGRSAQIIGRFWSIIGRFRSIIGRSPQIIGRSHYTFMRNYEDLYTLKVHWKILFIVIFFKKIIHTSHLGNLRKMICCEVFFYVD